MSDLDDDERKSHTFGHDLGDLGIILIAAIFALCFVYLLFSRWSLPHMKGFFGDSAPAAAGQKGETEMILFPSKPPAKPKQP